MCGTDWYALETEYCSNGDIKTYGTLDYEGQTYKTVIIGTQTWMAENLNYEASSSRCYDDLESNCDKYGRLYDWVTAMNFPPSCSNSSCDWITEKKGICPQYWHIPTDDEWTVLEKYVDPNWTSSANNVAGTLLKANSNLWITNTGTDRFGFSALPSGIYNGGTFRNVGSGGHWWSATTFVAAPAWYRSVSYNGENMFRGNLSKSSNLFSVRCVKDSD